jgi:hypothetical protein
MKAMNALNRGTCLMSEISAFLAGAAFAAGAAFFAGATFFAGALAALVLREGADFFRVAALVERATALATAVSPEAGFLAAVDFFFVVVLRAAGLRFAVVLFLLPFGRPGPLLAVVVVVHAFLAVHPVLAFDVFVDLALTVPVLFLGRPGPLFAVFLAMHGSCFVFCLWGFF